MISSTGPWKLSEDNVIKKSDDSWIRSLERCLDRWTKRFKEQCGWPVFRVYPTLGIGKCNKTARYKSSDGNWDYEENGPPEKH